LPINGIVLRTPDGEADMTLVKSKVLVVEDELLVARDIEQQLLDLGYQPVGLATRGEEAIALAKQTRPDLVLMDIQLAGDMDGIAAAQVIRNECALPVVFGTGQVDRTLWLHAQTVFRARAAHRAGDGAVQTPG
jgi:CheY-like chemotaxis protein